MAQQIINDIRKKLKEPLPGEVAQWLMAPVNRRNKRDYDNEPGFRPSAVLLLLCYDEHNELFIPLTERFAYDGVHAGQVSLPGGKFDKGDKNLVATALRECEEEIGVKENVEVLGILSKVYIPVSNFLVQPVVGFCPTPQVVMVPHIREVKHIVKLYVKDLLDEKIMKVDTIKVTGGVIKDVPYFEIEGLQVWGATAMILSEFKALLLSC